MQSALHQYAGTAQVDRLLDLLEDRLLGQNVALGVPHGAIERTEAAILRAEVRVVDIAIDDVADDPFRVPAPANCVGFHPDARQIMTGENIDRLLPGNTHARSP